MKMTAEDWRGRTAPGTAAETLGRRRLRNWSCNKWLLAMQELFGLYKAKQDRIAHAQREGKPSPRTDMLVPPTVLAGLFLWSEMSAASPTGGFALVDSRVAAASLPYSISLRCAPCP